MTVRGHALTVHTYGARGGRPIVVTERRRRLDPPRARTSPRLLAARGYFVVGFDARAYLSSFTSGGDDAAARGRARRLPRARRVRRDAASTTKPMLVGVSEGAGLSLLAATDPRDARRDRRRASASACPTSTSSAGAGRTRSSTSRTARRTSRRSAPRAWPPGWRRCRWRRSTPPTTSSCRSPRCSGSWPRRASRSGCGSSTPPTTASATTCAELDRRLARGPRMDRQHARAGAVTRAVREPRASCARRVRHALPALVSLLVFAGRARGPARRAARGALARPAGGDLSPTPRPRLLLAAGADRR